jgi:hypothetical protein
MDRLRREWKETKIPEEVRLRARNIAWAKIQRRGGGRRALGWAIAVSAAIAMAALIWILSGREAHIKQVSAPPPQDVSRTVITANQTEKPFVEAPEVLEPKQVNNHVDQIRASMPAEEPERVVLNFTLPESGARMIWIMDSRFNLNGGVE